MAEKIKSPADLLAMAGKAKEDLGQREDAVDIYVDGMRFATGRLLESEDGGLSMRLEQIYGL